VIAHNRPGTGADDLRLAQLSRSYDLPISRLSPCCVPYHADQPLHNQLDTIAVYNM
jgi:hypothetical protein